MFGLMVYVLYAAEVLGMQGIKNSNTFFVM